LALEFKECCIPEGKMHPGAGQEREVDREVMLGRLDEKRCESQKRLDKVCLSEWEAMPIVFGQAGC